MVVTGGLEELLLQILYGAVEAACFSVILDGYGYITIKGPLYLLR
jgi:hypothetical protein